jgi:dTDP-4-dehydrorhamnose reductase
LDRTFPEKFAEYAEKVAEQFPTIEYYIPINEPLTTARFSGLYGHWYPHRRDDFAFVSILINQLKATVLAIQKIRSINPEAKFIQTEDLCKVHSTPMMSYQAEFENIRRWLPYDLLCGEVNRSHRLWNYLIKAGIDITDLEFFASNPCKPDILGVHYYVTSERFLDERCDLYENVTAGSNGRNTYVDVEAVRTGHAVGLLTLLREAWERYMIPMAITEVHLACTREEQMRWFKEVWDTSCTLRNNGIPIEAVTAWALFGAYDWNSLLTKNTNYYESGVFDVKNFLRKTALAKMLSSIGATGDYEHPLLNNKGWWHQHSEKVLDYSDKRKERPLLIFGKSGSLAVAFSNVCTSRGISFACLSREEIDITSEKDVNRVIKDTDPWAVINATGYARIDDAESELWECYQINTLGSRVLARICNSCDIPLMTFSCDQVFSGAKRSPYYEYDEVSPVNNYGLTKALAETSVVATNSNSLVIRAGAFFSPWDNFNFAQRLLEALGKEKQFPVATDVIISPAYLPHLVNVALDLFIDEETGVWHLTNAGDALSWAEFALKLVEEGGYNEKRLVPRREKDMNWKAKRPSYSVLKSVRGAHMPPLNDAIVDYFRQIKS